MDSLLLFLRNHLQHINKCFLNTDKLPYIKKIKLIEKRVVILKKSLFMTILLSIFQQLQKLTFELTIITIDFFQAVFGEFPQIIDITMRPFVCFRVVIHVPIAVLAILSPWFAVSTAYVLVILDTVMPHPKIVAHFMCYDL